MTIEAGVLTLCCSDLAAPPLFWTDPDRTRHGYEPEAAQAVADALGLRLRWIFRQWSEFRPALETGECDGIWCGSAITPGRRLVFGYSTPYAIFGEGVVVRADDPAASAADLRGRRVGAIEESTNMRLAESFAGVETVAFSGDSDDVFGDMLDALRAGAVDAIVDDEPAFLDVERNHPGIRLAFSVATGQRWGCAMRPGDETTRELVDRGLAGADLRPVWERTLPGLAYPL